MDNGIAILLTGYNCEACNRMKNIIVTRKNGKSIKTGGNLTRENNKGTFQIPNNIPYTVESFRQLLTGTKQNIFPANRRLQHILEITNMNIQGRRENIVEIAKHVVVNDYRKKTTNIQTFRFIKGNNNTIDFKIEIDGVYNEYESNKFKEGYISKNDIPEFYYDLLELSKTVSRKRFMDIMRDSILPDYTISEYIKEQLKIDDYDEDTYKNIIDKIIQETHSYISFSALINAWVPRQLTAYFTHAPMWLVCNEKEYFDSVYDDDNYLSAYHNIGEMKPVKNTLRTIPIEYNNLKTKDERENYLNKLRIQHPEHVISMYITENAKF